MAVRGLVKKESRLLRQSVNAYDSVVTEVLDGTNTVEVVYLAVAADKISFQASGDLAGTVEFSIDGINFKNSTAIGGSNAIVTYTTSMAKVLKVTRSSGSGKLHIVAK